MNLHLDREAFTELVTASSHELHIPSSIIEKDYYVTLALRELSARINGMIFKGGTSLTKCYQILERFSEDIDISYAASEGVPGESKKDSSKGLLFPLWMRCSFQSRILKRHGADAVITVIGSAIQVSIHRPWN